MENLTLFIAVTSAAVVIQAGILVAMYLALRQTSARVEALANEVKNKVLPTAEVAHSMLVELRPQIANITHNLSDTSTMIRAQLERVDATVNDLIDRARLQVIRADELVSRTIDRVEETTEIMHKTVVSPVRQVTGLIRGLSVGVEALIGKRRRHGNGVNMPQDEMFI